MIIIEWNLWSCKEEAETFIEKMVSVGLICKVNRVDDSTWEELTERFRNNVERGVA
ncbi:hypothetical protein B14911_10872 [Bacillus sp. NRRL B-14911]|uniref:hypothetical protein n=1 Tax=Bacillus sp. NRRL B-14911 TaxID=313627 RepID=UPI00006B5991|nr:hypothetical protein [Bacillus sp. NRRL B-14911]EAR66232.1 hypothetical protein B14911_10872 [Bacillus sp. NRRL B-14911]